MEICEINVSETGESNAPERGVAGCEGVRLDRSDTSSPPEVTILTVTSRVTLL